MSARSADLSDSSSDSDASELKEVIRSSGVFDWQRVTPDNGADVYVQGLQLLGLDLAISVPKKIREEAITPLGQDPSSEIIVGRIGKTPAKERLLNQNLALVKRFCPCVFCWWWSVCLSVCLSMFVIVGGSGNLFFEITRLVTVKPWICDWTPSILLLNSPFISGVQIRF